jgi:hypothetical protein
VDCAGAGSAGPVCCGTGTLTGAPVTGCMSSSWIEPTGFTGSKCAASCASSYVICSQQSDCMTGTCTATKSNGSDFGYCK